MQTPILSKHLMDFMTALIAFGMEVWRIERLALSLFLLSNLSILFFQITFIPLLNLLTPFFAFLLYFIFEHLKPKWLLIKYDIWPLQPYNQLQNFISSATYDCHSPTSLSLWTSDNSLSTPIAKTLQTCQCACLRLETRDNCIFSILSHQFPNKAIQNFLKTFWSVLNHKTLSNL